MQMAMEPEINYPPQLAEHLRNAYRDGVRARQEGKPRSSCPFPEMRTDLINAYALGWHDTAAGRHGPVGRSSALNEIAEAEVRAGSAAHPRELYEPVVWFEMQAGDGSRMCPKHDPIHTR